MSARFRILMPSATALVVAALSGGCAPPDDTDDHALIPDSRALDPLADPGPVGAIGHTDPDDIDPEDVDAVGAPQPAPTPRPPMPTSPRAGVERAQPGVVVFGRVELQLDPSRRMPADYLLVRLRSERTVAEVWTTRSGEYFIRDVRPGSYELQFLTSPKDERPAYRHRIRVGGRADVAVPPVRIPIDSMAPRGRATAVP